MTTPWEDRRGMFQRGKEVHEPAPPRRTSGAGVADAVRRASVSSISSVEKTLSNSSAEPSSPSSQRRRSSGTGLFGNLTSHKRGGEDYADRRGSHSDQQQGAGLFSGWYNSTFRGYQKQPSAPGQNVQGGQAAGGGQDQKTRGVME